MALGLISAVGSTVYLGEVAEGLRGGNRGSNIAPPVRALLDPNDLTIGDEDPPPAGPATSNPTESGMNRTMLLLIVAGVILWMYENKGRRSR